VQRWGRGRRRSAHCSIQVHRERSACKVSHTQGETNRERRRTRSISATRGRPRPLVSPLDLITSPSRPPWMHLTKRQIPRPFHVLSEFPHTRTDTSCTAITPVLFAHICHDLLSMPAAPLHEPVSTFCSRLLDGGACPTFHVFFLHVSHSTT